MRIISTARFSMLTAAGWRADKRAQLVPEIQGDGNLVSYARCNEALRPRRKMRMLFAHETNSPAGPVFSFCLDGIRAKRFAGHETNHRHQYARAYCRPGIHAGRQYHQ